MAKWKLKDLFWVSSTEAEAAPVSTSPKIEVTASSEAPLEVDVELSAPRNPQVEKVLTMLRDVDGVVGSVAVTNAGELLGSDLPRLFEAPGLDALALRLSQLRAALLSADTPMKTAAFRYDGHALHISQLDCGLLGVLAELRTHEPALDMAARLVGQRLEATVGRSSVF
jgi:hypothetical protein